VTVGLWFANGGKPFFYQLRPGKGERIFKIIKFKTMNDRRDANGQLLPDAERLTKIGTFVRKTSLDEIPQLLNVLKGDMSLIGPRPLLVKYLPYYSKREQLRHTVRPGITGLAQVNGRNKLNWDDRLELDAQYVENLSFLLDIKILFRTIVNVLLRKDIAVGYIDLDDYRKNRNE
jgi:sugar transferase